MNWTRLALVWEFIKSILTTLFFLAIFVTVTLLELLDALGVLPHSPLIGTICVWLLIIECAGILAFYIHKKLKLRHAKKAPSST